MWLAMALVGCGDGGKDGEPNRQGDDDDADSTTPTPPDGCAVATIGPAGGSLQQDGVWVNVPPDAFDADTEVELCTDGTVDGFAPLSVVAVISAAVEPLVPVVVAVPFTAGTAVGPALWAEDARGALVRQLRATDSGGALAAPLYRLGPVFVAADPRVLEPYAAENNGQFDLLFVVDNSCSMDDEQDQLAATFPNLLTGLLGSGLDYHVGVTSTDLDRSYNGSQGKLVGVAGDRWIDLATPDPEDVFRQMVRLGTVGSGTEKGIGASYLALEAEAAGVNAGFLRDDAQLAVVVVTDEPDYTPAGVVSDAEFVLWFDDLKADPATAWFHGIVDPALGARYADTAAAVGGNLLPVTANDWWPFLQGVIDLFGVTGQALAVDAEEGTVEVWVVPADGSEPYPLDEDEFLFDDAANLVRVLPGVWDEDELVVLYLPD